MTGTLWELAFANIAFVGTHLVLSGGVVRPRLVGIAGEKGFSGLYAIVALATFVWAIIAYIDAPEIKLWQPVTAARHISLTVMFFACILAMAGLTLRNPTMFTAKLINDLRAAKRGEESATAAEDLSGNPEAHGMFKVTRHPLMWATALWGIVHILANGEAAQTILFAAMVILALAGTAHIDRRRRQSLGPAWDAFAAETSNIPLVALLQKRTRLNLKEIWLPVVGGAVLYAVLIYAHGWLFGVSPFTY